MVQERYPRLYELPVWVKTKGHYRTMIEHIVALLMFVGPDIKEHRIQNSMSPFV